MNIHQLAPDEPLSPELVLVFPPELRAQALARLGPPVRYAPPRRPVAAPPAVVANPRRPVASLPAVVAKPRPPSLGALIVARVGQLALIFVAVTLLTLLLSVVAQAMR